MADVPAKVEFQTGMQDKAPAADIAARFAPLRRKATAALARHRKLIANLKGDLEKHGAPDLWKRYGDLLLANIATARRDGDHFVVIDYFDETAPEIVIPADPNRNVTEAADEYFRRYAKARNAIRIIGERMATAEAAENNAMEQLAKIDAAIAEGDEVFLAALEPLKKKSPQISRKKKAEASFKGARKFTSSDGFEILVGKKAADNDFLTFRLARSLDTWLHAADYPGSHVIVRNAGKKEIPNRTLVEAARLAAYYSDAREVPKAAVNYSLKKYVNKPRRSAPGLVSLSEFKTLLVEPGVPDIEFEAPPPQRS